MMFYSDNIEKCHSEAERKKVEELAVIFHLTNSDNASSYLENLFKINYKAMSEIIFSDFRIDLFSMVFSEARSNLAEDLSVNRNDEVGYAILYDLGIRVNVNTYDYEFFVDDMAKSKIEERIMEIIKQDGDIALSETSKILLEKINIDLNELMRKVKEERSDEKEQQTQQEEEQAVAIKKQRQRMGIM